MAKNRRGEEWILDRWEGDHGVIEGLGPVPRALLPRGLSEGDVIVVVAEADRVTIARDKEATRRRREHLQRLRNELNRADGDGDVFEL